MNKIKVCLGFKDLQALNPQQRIYNAEFNSISEMSSFIAREGVRGNIRILALIKNLKEDFIEGSTS